MKLIAITTDTSYKGETKGVIALFKEGLERLHLRKPKASKEDLDAWLKAIPIEYLGRIVLHDHFELTKKYPLGGIHLNSRNPNPIPQKGTVSRSCHSVKEITENKGLDYYFLSPAFNSISKEACRPALDLEAVKGAFEKGLLGNNVYALGGVTPGRIPMLKEIGFGGIAVLGALWGGYAHDKDVKALVNRYQLFEQAL